MHYEMLPLGDKAILIRLGAEISEQTHTNVIHLLERLESSRLPGIIEFVPAYCSITIHYDPVIVWKGMKQSVAPLQPPSHFLLNYIESILQQFSYEDHPSHKLDQQRNIIEIPVCYGDEYGPDLNDVARYNGLSNEDVIHMHSGVSYLVHMLGFVPGFPYLGGMDHRIAMPRKAIPRAAIAAGSVGIAGEQTGIYPLSTPGGWRIIGRTPLQLFHPQAEIPTLIQAGDWIKFIPITKDQFQFISNHAG